MNLVKAQELIDELEALCKKHNIALIGGSSTNNSYGNIFLFELDELTENEIDHLSSGDSPYKNEGFTVVNGIS